MRKIILIAAMALTSAAAQAGETRGLSVAAAPSVAPATIQTKQLQAQNDAPVAQAQTPVDPARNVPEAPRYTARPTPVDYVTPTGASTAHPERRYDDRGYFDDAGYHPFARRYTDAEPPHARTGRPHHRAQWSVDRIIAELHSYGIYW
jgi:hypothetical protein